MVSYTTPPPLNAEHSHGPNPYDVAQTFGESDVTLSFTDLIVDSESVSFDPNGYNTGSNVTRAVDNYTYGSREDRGVVINPNTDIYGVQATISSDTLSTIYSVTVYNSAGNVVGQNTNTGNVGPGDTVFVPANLSAGTDYWLFADSDRPAGLSGAAFPYTSTDIDVVGGSSSVGNSGTNYFYCFSKVTAAFAVKSGSVTVGWSTTPTDIYEWDTATFTRTLDGETVDVYVAYNDGTGWARTNGGNAIKRNYSLANDSNISASDDVRIEAEFSRTDTANNPTLDSAYRTWKL